MTNYSFDPPAKKAMDEAELSELISGLSADESGIEQAMMVLQEQEALRLEDEQEFQNWREAMIADGSVEALRALEKVTGEVLVEPDPEVPTETEADVSDAESDGADETAGAIDEVEKPQDPDEEESEPLDSGSGDESTELVEISDEEQLTAVEIIEESVSVKQVGEEAEVTYASKTVSVEVEKVKHSDSLSSALDEAVSSTPRKIRQKLSNKFVLGLSLAAGIFTLLILIGDSLLVSSPWSSVGMVVGSVLSFGIFAAHSFQKQSLIAKVANLFGSLGVYLRFDILIGLALVLIGVSNLVRDSRAFGSLDVQSAQVFDYKIDEVTLIVAGAVLLASVIAWQPMLRMGLLRILAPLALGSLVLILSGVEFSAFSLGDFDGYGFSSGLAASLAISLGLSLFFQPSFAADHDRAAWAVGEFNTRKRRVSTLHSFLFVLLPGVLAFLVISSEVSLSSLPELAQTGLLIGFGLGLAVALMGALDQAGIFSRASSLVIVLAGLIGGEFLTDYWVEGFSILGVVVLAAFVGSATVLRFANNVRSPIINLIGIIVATAAGWIAENPFGLLDLGFEQYSELSGAGLGLLTAFAISALVSLMTIQRSRVDENS